ncbi:MAG: hypothetical protein JSR27_09935 [Proteobacteria bacterium]|nr:hypothetical protein [Pseudomonadota bacterium]
MRGILSAAVWVLASLILCEAAHAAAFVVNVGGSAGLAFQPKLLNIMSGDTVVFVNKGGFHNAVADNGSFRCAQGCDGDGKGGSGNASRANWVANVTFTKPGKVGYFCEVHGQPGAGMYGTIMVNAPPAVPAPGLGAKLALVLGCALALMAMFRLKRS